jgi:hypothetical protein
MVADSNASVTEAKSISLSRLWQFGYILDELSFAVPVTSTLHCLVAMEANPPGSTVLEGKSGELCRIVARV